MALIHEPHHRSTMQVIEAMIFGETMEERDEKIKFQLDKKNVLNLYKNGFSPKEIAKGLKLKLEFVRTILAENESKANGKKK